MFSDHEILFDCQKCETLINLKWLELSQKNASERFLQISTFTVSIAKSVFHDHDTLSEDNNFETSSSMPIVKNTGRGNVTRKCDRVVNAVFVLFTNNYLFLIVYSL